MTCNYRLYAVSHSLYSGRARAYLIKSRIPFDELSSGHESFKAEVFPNAKLPTLPTLITPKGEVIRDGAAIIEYFESQNGRAFAPRSPRQAVVSLLFDVIGAEGLLRPAMHYRWNFPEENLDFVRYHFFHSQRVTDTREAKTNGMMDKMRQAAMLFGVAEDSVPLVETLYLEYLDALDAHFARLPYLLGWKPCIGDFGLLAPMFAHLGRDPHPLRIMQQRAPRVYRWLERMNRPDQDAFEFFDAGSDWLADDEVPDTLVNVMKILAEDFVPETLAAAKCINAWLDKNQPETGAPAVGSLAQSPAGSAEFRLRGETVSARANPYRFYMLQRVQDAYALLGPEDRVRVSQLLENCGMTEILTAKLDRRIGRADNLEVWEA